MTKNGTILIIDDETQIRRFLRAALEPHEYHIVEAATAREGSTLAACHNPDIIILDLGLPDKDGQELLVQLREWYKKPIIILSVRDDEENLVRALDNGANDYLKKPFSLGELLARLRVCHRMMQPQCSEPILRLGELVIDIPNHKVTNDGSEVKLTATEYDLLKLLAENAGKVLTHRHILQTIWGPGAGDNVQYLRVYIGHLRQKIEKDPNRPLIILTEPAVGYRFCR